LLQEIWLDEEEFSFVDTMATTTLVTRPCFGMIAVAVAEQDNLLITVFLGTLRTLRHVIPSDQSIIEVVSLKFIDKRQYFKPIFHFRGGDFA